MKKTFRVGMACLLVLALLLYLSPVRVSASAIPEAAAVVTKVIPFAKVVEPAALGLGGTIFCWAAAAVGVIFTGYQAVQAYNDFQDFTGLLETSIYYYPDGSWSYGVDMGFVERVRAFLFHEGILVDKLTTIDPNNMPSAAAMAEAQSALYAALVYTKRSTVVSYHLFYSNESPVYAKAKYADGTGTKMGTESASATLYNYNAPTDSFSAMKGLAVEGNSSHKIIAIHMIGTTAAPEYATTWEDTEIGVVAPPEVPIPEAYPEWNGNARPAVNPDTQEEITVLPIPFNPSADPETQIGTLTQPEIWQGTIADPMPDTGALPDGSIAETPWSDVQDWLTPSGDPGRFGIQLRDYFPFCIPFDLYDFLTVLAAEPEAPCFEWEVPVPQMGRTFKVEVDLAAWDSVAALFRKLELLAFIVGLGWVTREKIRG